LYLKEEAVQNCLAVPVKVPSIRQIFKASFEPPWDARMIVLFTTRFQNQMEQMMSLPTYGSPQNTWDEIKDKLFNSCNWEEVNKTFVTPFFRKHVIFDEIKEAQVQLFAQRRKELIAMKRILLLHMKLELRIRRLITHKGMGCSLERLKKPFWSPIYILSIQPTKQKMIYIKPRDYLLGENSSVWTFDNEALTLKNLPERSKTIVLKKENFTIKMCFPCNQIAVKTFRTLYDDERLLDNLDMCRIIISFILGGGGRTPKPRTQHQHTCF